MMFLPSLLQLDNEKLPRASNPIQYLEKEYLSESTFFGNLTAPTKEFPKAKSVHYTTTNLSCRQHKYSPLVYVQLLFYVVLNSFLVAQC